MVFEHRVVLPDGGSVRLREMANSDYLVLLKLMDGERPGEVFAHLDAHIGGSVPRFGEMALPLRLYVYLSFVRLCVRPSVTVRGKLEREVSVSSMLDALADSLGEVPREVVLPLAGGVEGVFGPPCRFSATEDPDAYEVDFMSGLAGVRKGGAAVKATRRELDALAAAIPPADAMRLERRLRREYAASADLFGGGGIGLFDGGAIAAVYRMLGEPLEVFYQYGYVFGRYLRISWSDYLSMTPVESLVMFRHFEEDARQRREERERAEEERHNPGDPPGMRRFDPQAP